jgi:hypothetical protein
MKIKALKRYFFMYTSTDGVTIFKEMYKTHVTEHNFLRVRKSNEVIFLGRNVSSYSTCNPLPYLRCNGSATVTSYCYLKCNKNVTSYYKK